MTEPELSAKYMELRKALAEAYAAPVWDSAHIDSIADALAPLEQALASGGQGSVKLAPPQNG